MVYLAAFIYLKIFLFLTKVFLLNIQNKSRTNFIETTLVLGIFILLFPHQHLEVFFTINLIFFFTLVGFLHSIKLKKTKKIKTFNFYLYK